MPPRKPVVPLLLMRGRAVCGKFHRRRLNICGYPRANGERGDAIFQTQTEMRPCVAPLLRGLLVACALAPVAPFAPGSAPPSLPAHFCARALPLLLAPPRCLLNIRRILFCSGGCRGLRSSRGHRHAAAGIASPRHPCAQEPASARCVSGRGARHRTRTVLGRYCAMSCFALPSVSWCAEF